MLFNTCICYFLVLALYKLIKMYAESESLIETSRINMRPSLSVYCFLNKKKFLSQSKQLEHHKNLFFREKRKLDL